jgi:hypothetical protein
VFSTIHSPRRRTSASPAWQNELNQLRENGVKPMVTIRQQDTETK